jgi:hypothetical protein
MDEVKKGRNVKLTSLAVLPEAYSITGKCPNLKNYEKHELIRIN